MSILFAIAAVFVVTGGWFLLSGPHQGDSVSYGADRHNRIADRAPAFLAADLAARIFSRVDRDFIERTRCLTLRRLYLVERRKVATHWLRHTMLEVGQIMREHRLRSRQSSNLNVFAEARLFFLYLELKLLCGFMLVLIHILGPHALADLASRAGGLYQRIARSLVEVAAGSAVEPTRKLAA